MARLAVTLALVATCAALNEHPYRRERPRRAQTFASFMDQFGRTYEVGSQEHEHRRGIFETRMAEIERLNNQPGQLWAAGINPYTDWTDDELKSLRGLRLMHSSANFGVAGSFNSRVSFRQVSHATVLPSQILWTNLTATKTIRDQGFCGSCWAVAASTMLDATHEIARGVKGFSVQELVDCVQNQHECGGSGGCQGATVELAMDHLVNNGLADSAAVPYQGRDTQCKKTLVAFTQSTVESDEKLQSLISSGTHFALPGSAGEQLGLVSWSRLPENRYLPLMHAVVDGPVAVSVSAATWAFYSSGIFDGCDKDPIIDHAVTLIGYGIDSAANKKFWLIQNSWGSFWGESGRIRLLREDNDESNCGIDPAPSEGTGCKGGPVTVKVCGQCGILYDNVVAKFKKDV